MDRDQLLKYNTKENKLDSFPMVLTYSHQLPDVHKIVNKRMNLIRRSTRLTKIFQQPPIVAYKRGSNLEDILVHKKHVRVLTDTDQSKHCCKCVICKHFYTQKECRSPGGKQFTFHNNVGCKTSNVVYGIYCAKCNKIVYIGETGVTIYERFQNHLSSIRNNKNHEPVARHFTSDEHTAEDVKIVGVEKVRKKDIHLRKVRESFSIKKMGTLQPDGLNQNAGISDTFRV